MKHAALAFILLVSVNARLTAQEVGQPWPTVELR
jgi:hypothetical protein